MIHPTPNRLVRHRHSAFRQQIFDVAQAQGEPEVKPYRLLNDLGRETIPAVADLVHPRAATRPPRTPQARSAVTMPLCLLALAWIFVPSSPIVPIFSTPISRASRRTSTNSFSMSFKNRRRNAAIVSWSG